MNPDVIWMFAGLIGFLAFILVTHVLAERSYKREREQARPLTHPGE